MGLEKIGARLIQNTANSFKISTAKNGFSRLKSVFINSQNYENYAQIVGTCKRPILGNIPNEFINIILQKYLFVYKIKRKNYKYKKEKKVMQNENYYLSW